MTASDHGWMAANPFLAPSSLPFGYPDFTAIREEHFLPAFVEGMARQRAEVDAITADPAPPTFENTIVALERSGDVLRRVSAVFFVLASSCSTEGIRAVEAEVAPLLAAHADAILLDPALFARIEAVPTARLDPEARRLVERYHRDAVRAGARLAPAQQERLRAINAELSSLTTEFGNRLLAGPRPPPCTSPTPTQLDGLAPDAPLGRGASRPLPRPRRPPPHPRAPNRTARPRRPHPPGPAGTTAHRLRHPRPRRRARHPRDPRSRSSRCAPSGPACSATRTTPRGSSRPRPPPSVEAVDAMLHRGSPRSPPPTPARRPTSSPPPRDTPSPRGTAPSTPSGCAASASPSTPPPCVPTSSWSACSTTASSAPRTCLYGLRFAERHDLPTYHPDVRVFDVSDDDGPLGLFVADLYARDSKRGGAWMNAFVEQSHLLGTRPVVLNTLNIPKPADGEPTLLTFELGPHPLPRVRPRPARPVLRRAVPDVRRARPCRATSSSTPRRSTRCGWRTRRSSPPTPATTRPASRSRPSCSTGSRRPAASAKAPRPRSTWPPRCSTRRGTGSAPDAARHRRRGVRSRRAARPSTCRACRRATAPPTSTTSSAGPTAPGTTPTSGARCSTPTPSSGSPSTAGCAGRTASASAASCSPAAAPSTRWRPTRAFRGRGPDVTPLLVRRGLQG